MDVPKSEVRTESAAEAEGKEGPVEFIVECDCEWEPEHGMEIVAFSEEIIHVGSYDGDLDYWKEEYLSKEKDR